MTDAQKDDLIIVGWILLGIALLATGIALLWGFPYALLVLGVFALVVGVVQESKK